MGKVIFGVGQFNEGVDKLDLGVGICQLKVGKLNFTHNPLRFQP